jgi:hypothetical protein
MSEIGEYSEVEVAKLFVDKLKEYDEFVKLDSKVLIK